MGWHLMFYCHFFGLAQIILVGLALSEALILLFKGLERVSLIGLNKRRTENYDLLKVYFLLFEVLEVNLCYFLIKNYTRLWFLIVFLLIHQRKHLWNIKF